MGVLKSIIEAIEGRMTALGYKATEEVFNFDAVPNSIVHQSYRIETGSSDNIALSDNYANTIQEITIWVAYKTYRKARTAWKTAQDEQETIEKDLINASAVLGLSSDPYLWLTNKDMEEMGDDYLVSQMVFRCDYLRSVASS